MDINEAMAMAAAPKPAIPLQENGSPLHGRCVCCVAIHYKRQFLFIVSVSVLAIIHNLFLRGETIQYTMTPDDRTSKAALLPAEKSDTSSGSRINDANNTNTGSPVENIQHTMAPNKSTSKAALLPTSIMNRSSDYRINDASDKNIGPLSCEKVAGTNPYFPGVSIEGKVLTKNKTNKCHDCWGNMLSPYWAARAYAELGGYTFEGGPIGPANGWMRYLPTNADAQDPKPKELHRFCNCTFSDGHATELYQYFHRCNGWRDIYQTIRNDTRNALQLFMETQNSSQKHKAIGFFGDNDWLVYNRCNIFNHGEQGFGSVDVYDAIPSTGKFTVFTLANYGRCGGVEHQGLCPELDQVRDKRIKLRNPNLRIVNLPPSDMWVDFARLVFAPNVINPSAGSSWTLWSLLANSGNVKTVPHHGGPNFPAMNVSIYPPNFEVLNTSVLYPPELWPETRQCVQFRLLNLSDPVHREKLLRCFDKNPKIEVIPKHPAKKKGQGKQNENKVPVNKAFIEKFNQSIQSDSEIFSSGFQIIPFILRNGTLLCHRAHRTVITDTPRFREVAEMIHTGIKIYRQENLVHKVRSELPFLLISADGNGCYPTKQLDHFNFPRLTWSYPSPKYSTNWCKAIPVPTYASWNSFHNTHKSHSSWEFTFASYQKRYPWSSKINKAVWRGSPTRDPHYHGLELNKIPRGILVKKSMEHSSMIDAGFTQLLNFESKKEQLSNQTILTKHMVFNHQMKYKAIIDIDGNNWSSRFPKLLCTNSVVIKIDPDYVEHFYHELIPMVHYVPASLDNVTQVAAYVLGEENKEEMRTIILAANTWCKRRMTEGEMAKDMMLQLEKYQTALYCPVHSNDVHHESMTSLTLHDALVECRGGLDKDSED